MMAQMYEGMRVVLVKEVRTVIMGNDGRLWNPHTVTYENGITDTLSVVPVGTIGTVYRFRIRKGLPTCGMPHAEMWAVVYDGVPQPINEHFGQSEQIYLGSHLLEHTPQSLELQGLREDWMVSLSRRKQVEQMLADLHAKLPIGKYHVDMPDTWLKLKQTTLNCDRAQKRYDEAAHIPSREV